MAPEMDSLFDDAGGQTTAVTAAAAVLVHNPLAEEQSNRALERVAGNVDGESVAVDEFPSILRRVDAVLSRSDGKPTLLYHGLVADLIIIAIFIGASNAYTLAHGADMDEPNGLLWVHSWCWTAAMLLLLIPLRDVRLCLHAGDKAECPSLKMAPPAELVSEVRMTVGKW